MSPETITWWNVAAADGLDWAWRAGLASLAVLAALLVARPLLKRRLSAHAASWLWLLPLVPLMAPPIGVSGWVDPFPALPLELAAADGGTSTLGTTSNDPEPVGTSETRATRDATNVGRSNASSAPNILAPGPDAAQTLADEEPAARAAVADLAAGGPVGTGPRLGVATAFALVWLAVALTGVALVLLRLARTAALVRRATGRPDTALAARFDTLARHAGLDRRVDLRLTNELETPATTGFWRATVLLPNCLARELDAPALDWILRHELTHVRRRDVLVSTLVHLVRALWPLHPAVWLAPLFAERERELACDEAALAREPRADGPRAAQTLLHVLERRRSTHHLATGAVPLAHPESLERRRIMKLLDPAVRATRGLSPFTALGLVVAGVGLLGSGLRPAAVEPAPVSALEPAVAAVAQVAVEPAATDTPLAQDDFFAPAVEPEPQTPDRHTVVASALRYLIANQSEDGRWRASTSDAADAAAGEFDDVGVTANAILALLDAPAGFEFAGRERALARAIAWLAEQQSDETGAIILSGPSWYTNPSHARALSAWIAYHTSSFGDPDSDAWLERARRAVDYCERARNPYRGWRYDYPPAGDNDSVVTGWMLSALAAARDVGIEVDRDTRQGGFDVLDENHDPNTGRVGYIGRGTATSRIWPKKDDFPGELVEFPTAVALCAHLDWGTDLIETDRHVGSLTLLASKPPRWSRGEGTTDSYYWVFGTRAIQHLGGALAERWNRKLESALLDHFDRDAGGRVYWAAVDAWHAPGSEVAMTAMCVLALQAIEATGSDH